MQAIAPEDFDIFGLSDKVRLMRQHDRGQPRRIGEGDQSAFPGNVTGEIREQSEESWVAQCRRERNPLGLINVIGERTRMPELGPADSDLFPSVQAPPSALPFRTGAESMEPRLEASVMEPRRDDDIVVVADRNLVGEAPALVQDAINFLLAGFLS